MKLSIITGALLCALFLSLIPNLDEPKTESNTAYLSESDALRYELCFKDKRDMSNEDLNHFCEGAK